MNDYKITVKHDAGKYTLKVTAKDEQAARLMVMKSENCPPSAIIKITFKPCLYKVVKVMRVSCRRKVLARNLSIVSAQTLVKSFPDNKNSMVFYFKQ